METKEFKNYSKFMKANMRNIMKELVKPDTNFRRILRMIETMEGRTRNFV